MIVDTMNDISNSDMNIRESGVKQVVKKGYNFTNYFRRAFGMAVESVVLALRIGLEMRFYCKPEYK